MKEAIGPKKILGSLIFITEILKKTLIVAELKIF
jgi:hypothetical protein